jgi:hypothetical protein
MEDLGEQIRRQIAEAHEEAQRQRERGYAGLMEQADAVRKLQAHGRELNGLIRRRFTEAAEVSAGSMRYGSAWGMGLAADAHWLTWLSPRPERTLKIELEAYEGRLTWLWYVEDQRIDRRRVDPMTFDEAELDRLIVALGDQSMWGMGRVPEV